MNAKTKFECCYNNKHSMKKKTFNNKSLTSNIMHIPI